MLAGLLQQHPALPVRIAEDAEVTSRGNVVPQGWTALLSADYRLELVHAERGAGGDTLLRSAAMLPGPRLIGAV